MIDFLKGIAGPVIQGIGSIFGAASSAKSIKDTNKSQIDQANAQWDKYVELANSAHQREVKDLLAAGLSPILSAGGSGAASAMSAMPTINVPGSAYALAGKDAGGSFQNAYTNAKMIAETKAAQAAAKIAENEKKHSDQKQAVRDKNPQLVTHEVVGESNRDVQGLAVGGWEALLSTAMQGARDAWHQIKKRPFTLGW